MKQQMMYRLEALLLGLAIAMIYAGPVFAQANVATQSAVYVERVSGADTRRLEPALQLSRGDRVITLVNWYRVGGQGSFTITNPLPRAVAYQSSTWDNQEVSVDGGRTWGRLGDLRVGARYATPEDVTHVRWRIPANRFGRGQVAYSGIVR